MFCFVLFSWLCPQHVEVPGLGSEPVPQQQPEPKQILSPLSHQGTPWKSEVLLLALTFPLGRKEIASCLYKTLEGRGLGHVPTMTLA